MEEHAWHAQTTEQAVGLLGGHRNGLSHEEVVRRQKQYGKNALPDTHRVSVVRIFVRQFVSPLVVLLGIAGVVSFFLGDRADVISIFAVLFLNAFLGFVQEYRADRRMHALRALVGVLATVRRNGEMVQISAEDLVPGDLVFLRAGMRLGADVRFLDTHDVATHEAALTGESREIEKHTDKIAETAPLFDRANMAFMGTSIARGSAQAMVVATGSRTVFANIARQAQDTKSVVGGFQQELQKTANALSVGVLACAFALFLLGLVRGESVFLMARTSIALAVAAVPEGLLIATTVALAVALQRMAKARALVRELHTPERLSAVDVLCLDKTGTLTTGNMEVQVCDTAHSDRVRLALSGLTEQSRAHASLALSLTEQALGRYVVREGVVDVAVAQVVPFSSGKKYSEVTLQEERRASIFRLGAPEALLPLVGDESAAVSALKDRAQALVRQGLRVLMLVERHEHDDHFSFLAFFGIADPLRSDAKDMVARVRAQGVRLIMLTGDHQETAQGIATQLGMDGTCVQGTALRALSDAELARALRGVSVIARMVPEDKLRIVRALQADGFVVAMTGDGVNDSPALAAADVGIALQSGTDVAREVADVVLLDDRLATISRALEEGRGTFLALQRIVAYLLMLSLSEMVVFACALVAGSHLPLSSVQILWLNIIADGIPAFGLAAFISYDPAEVQLPRPKIGGLFTPALRSFLWWGTGALMLPLCVLFFTTQDLPDPLRAGMFFIAFVLDALFVLWLFAHVRRVASVFFLLVVSLVGFGVSLVPFFVFSSEMTMPSVVLFLGLCALSLAKCGVLWLIWRVILVRPLHVPRALVS